jgi:hypothetical protein
MRANQELSCGSMTSPFGTFDLSDTTANSHEIRTSDVRISWLTQRQMRRVFDFFHHGIGAGFAYAG